MGNAPLWGMLHCGECSIVGNAPYVSMWPMGNYVVNIVKKKLCVKNVFGFADLFAQLME